MTATATRINSLHVSARTKTGAPRLFQAKPGEYTKQYICFCPKGASGCSHTEALYTLLHQEAAAMKMEPAHVVA